MGAPRLIGCCLAPPPVPLLCGCCACCPDSRHPAAVVAWHVVLCRSCGRRRASLPCLLAPRWCAAPPPVRSLPVLRSALPSPWCLPPPRGLLHPIYWVAARGTWRPAKNRAHGACRWPLCNKLGHCGLSEAFWRISTIRLRGSPSWNTRIFPHIWLLFQAYSLLLETTTLKYTTKSRDLRYISSHT